MAKQTKEYQIMERVLADNRMSPMSGLGPRDSDTELIVQMLQLHMGIFFTEPQLQIIKGLNFESITRARRKLQSEGKFMPTLPEVMHRRRLKAAEIQQVAPKETASGLQGRIAS